MSPGRNLRKLPCPSRQVRHRAAKAGHPIGVILGLAKSCSHRIGRPLQAPRDSVWKISSFLQPVLGSNLNHEKYQATLRMWTATA